MKKRLRRIPVATSKPDYCNLDWLARTSGNDDGLLASYFMIAADRLVDSVAARRRGNADDGLFMPIAFLYRHSVELLLKDIIQLGTIIGTIRTEEIVPDGILRDHNLLALWNVAAICITRRWPGENNKTLKDVKLVVEDFNSMDPDGQGFRYSLDKKRRLNKTRYPRGVVLTDFRDTIKRLVSLLDTCRIDFIDLLVDMEDKHIIPKDKLNAAHKTGT